MKTRSIILTLCLTLFLITETHAVKVNPQGDGEVLLFPYYTVNGDFNTFYSVVNTTDQPKAIKVRFLEGHNAQLALSFNVYLSAHDVWTGTLTPTTSSIATNLGEPSVLHSSTDGTCAPYLEPIGQEFLPYYIPKGDVNTNMERTREGHIEVIEMGVVTGSSATAATHDATGIPNDCEQLEDAWTSGYWLTDPTQDMAAPSGGLTGSVVLLNVPEGHMLSYDATALEAFWQGPGLHTEPGDLSLNLSQAAPNSSLQTNLGQVTFHWDHGHQAVSGALMKHQLHNSYNVQPHVLGQSDWILNWPTKAFHNANVSSLPPFSETWNGTGSCDPLEILQTDSSTLAGNIQPLSACRSIASLTFQSSNALAGSIPNIFSSLNNTLVPPLAVNSTTELGWGRLTFDAVEQQMVDTNGKILRGLPVIGFGAQKYVNAAAAEGLLAVYSQTNPFAHTTQTLPDLIFANGFEVLD